MNGSSAARGNTDISKMMSKNYMANNSSHFKMIESGKTSSCYSTRGGDMSMQQAAGGGITYGAAAASGPNTMRRTRAKHAAGYEQPSRVSAYMQRFQANTDTNQFWADIRTMATHQNKIENLDSKIAQERGLTTEPLEKTTLYTRSA